jgi:hypothetical protein
MIEKTVSMEAAYRRAYALLEETQRDCNLTVVEDFKDVRDVLDDLRTQPVLAPCRVIIVRDGKAFAKKLPRKFKDDSQNVLILVEVTTPKPTTYFDVLSLMRKRRKAEAITLLYEVMQADRRSPIGAFLCHYKRCKAYPQIIELYEIDQAVKSGRADLGTAMTLFIVRN